MFYKMNEYFKWLEETKTSSSYKVKYYKGLGTLGPQLGKELFKDLDKHLIPFNHGNLKKTADTHKLQWEKKNFAAECISSRGDQLSPGISQYL